MITLSAILALAGCGAPFIPGPGSPSPAPDGGARTVTREAASPDPNFDYGFVIQITTDGFRPRTLVATCCHPIIWRNRTAAATSVVFDHLLVDSGPIRPGATFVYTPRNIESISYHSGTLPPARATIQVNTPLEP